MRWHLIGLALLTSTSAPGLAQTPRDPHALVNAAIEAMGGPAVRALASLRLDGVQQDYALGNAERAEGPWRALYSRFSELRDLAGTRFRRTTVNASTATGREGVTILTDSVLLMRAGGHEGPGFAGFFEDHLDRLNASPERVLLSASSASGLRWDRMVTRFGIPHDVVSFPYADGRMRVELSRESHLPTAVEFTRTYAYDVRRAAFGDVTVRIEYVDWTVEANGLWWPHQSRFIQNGQFFRDVTISALVQNPVAPPDSFAVPDSIRLQYATSLHRASGQFKVGDAGTLPDITDGIARFPDYWATTVVRQEDGFVVFEAHLSGDYLKGVIAAAEQRWPGLTIKALVMTSDPWAHIGGVREAVALGIPIYVNARSVPFLTALTKASFTINPDHLARSPRAPRFRPVASHVVIGSGTNRIDLYPVGGPYGERMTMAYFPEHRLLYGADLVFPANFGPPGTPAGPGYDRTPAWDLRRAVAREGLSVDTVFCVQRNIAPVAWKDFIPEGMQP